MRHHLTTVPLTRVGTEEVGGWLFFAVCDPGTPSLVGIVAVLVRSERGVACVLITLKITISPTIRLIIRLIVGLIVTMSLIIVQ